MNIDTDPLELSLTDDEKFLAAFGWYKTANIPSSEPHRDALILRINDAFGLNADRDAIWANDGASLWLVSGEGSWYVTNTDCEFIALVADSWNMAMENLLREEQEYEGPVRRSGQKYDRNASDESASLEEWYEERVVGGNETEDRLDIS